MQAFPTPHITTHKVVTPYSVDGKSHLGTKQQLTLRTPYQSASAQNKKNHKPTKVLTLQGKHYTPVPSLSRDQLPNTHSNATHSQNICQRWKSLKTKNVDDTTVNSYHHSKTKFSHHAKKKRYSNHHA